MDTMPNTDSGLDAAIAGELARRQLSQPSQPVSQDKDSWVDAAVAQEQARRATTDPDLQRRAMAAQVNAEKGGTQAGVDRPEAMDYVRLAGQSAARLFQGVGSGLRAVGLEAPGKWLEDAAGKDVAAFDNEYSPGWRAMQSAPMSWHNAGQKIVAGAVGMAPSLMVMGPVGELAGGAAATLGAGAKAARVVGAGVGGAAGFGLPTAGELAQQIQDADQEKLASVPRFQEIYNSLGDVPEAQRFDAAKRQMTNEAVAGRLGWEGVINSAMGPLAEPLRGALGGASKSGVVNFARNVAEHGVTGAGFGAGSAVAGNIAANRYLGEDSPLTQGMGEAALETGLMGGVMGAGQGGRRAPTDTQLEQYRREQQVANRKAFNAETGKIVDENQAADEVRRNDWYSLENVNARYAQGIEDAKASGAAPFPGSMGETFGGDALSQTMQSAGVADKPEWRQAVAEAQAIANGGQGKPREVTPELQAGGSGGDDAYDQGQAFVANPDEMLARPGEETAAQAQQQTSPQRDAFAEENRQAMEEPIPQQPQKQPAAPKVLSRQEQAQVNTLTKRIDNLTKLLAVEKNPAARARIEETRNGYEVERRNLTGETADVLTPEEQARANEVRQSPAALPAGQGFGLVGEPTDYTRAEGRSLEDAAIPADQGEGSPGMEMPAKDSRAFDAGKDMTDDQIVRQYQEQRQRAGAAEYGAKPLSQLWNFLRGRLDAKSISDTFGPEVLNALRSKAPRDLFNSSREVTNADRLIGRTSRGQSWDLLEDEAKRAGLVAPDGNLIDTLMSNVTTKEQAQRDRVSGVNDVWQREELPVGSDMPAPEETGMVPLNSDGTERDGAGPMYRKGKETQTAAPSADDVKAKLAGTPFEDIAVHDSPSDHPNAALARYMEESGNSGAKGVTVGDKPTVFAGNHESIDDAVKSVIHEAAHQGIASLRDKTMGMSDDARRGATAVNNVLESIYGVKAADIREWLKTDEGKLYTNDFDTRTAAGRQNLAEEWLAHTQLGDVTNPAMAKWHDRYVAAITKWLRAISEKLGVNIKWTDAETRDFLRQAFEARQAGQEPYAWGGEAQPVFAKAYHGTPYRGIEQFDWENNRGRGEGAAAYGEGTYFTDTKGIAEDYRKKLNDPTASPRRFFQGQEVQPGTPEYHAGTLLDRNGATLAGVRKEVRGWIENAKAGENVEHYKNVLSVLDRAEKKGDFKRRASQGQLYEVDIPDSHELLDWDKPLSEQPEGVREKLKSALGDEYLGSDTGARLYKQLSSGFLADRVGIERSPKAASQYLRSIGIPGHQYLDGMSRGKGEGSHNYVIYDDSRANITNTFYRKAAPQETPSLYRPEDGMAGEPEKTRQFTKEGMKDWFGKQYQAYVDRYYPILRDAKNISEAAKGQLQNAISYVRGAGGAAEQALTGKGEIPNYAASDPTQRVKGSQSLLESLSPVSGDKQASEALALALKGERSIALAQFRPEILREDYKADRKYWTEALNEANTAQERVLIREQLKSLKEQYERGVKGIDREYWENRLDEVKTEIGPEKWANVQDAAKGFRKYMKDAVLDRLHEAGIISDESYQKISSAPENEWYAPFQREMQDVERQYVGHRDVIKQLKGSNRNTIDPVESAIAYTERAIRLVAENNVNRKFMEVRNATPELQDIIKPVKGNPALLNQKNYIRVIENGKKTYYEAPKEYIQAINGMDQQDASLFHKVMSLPAKTLRFGATMSMEFPIRNFMRDQWTAMVNSDYNYLPFVDALRGLKHIVFNDDMAKEWQAAGGDQAYFTSLDRAVKSVQAKEILGLQQKGLIQYASSPKAAWGLIVKGLRAASDTMEKATRVGLYANARGKGASPLEAATESRMGTLDFARQGLQGKAMNQIIAFWNANIQDADIMTRRLINKPAQTLSKIALGITLPSVALWAAQHDDDRWKEIQPWVKATCWVILPWWDKQASPICIPKPFLMGAIFGSAPEFLLDYAVGNDKNGLSNAVKGVVQAGVPGFLPTALTPLVENQTNYSFFRSQPLENANVQNLPPGLRANTQTQDVFRGMGSLTDISPIKMENMWRGYTGNLGMAGSAAISAGLNAVTGKESPPAVAQRLTEMPGIRAVFGREPIGSASKSVNDFYENYKDAEQARFAYRSFLKSGDKAAAEKYFNDNRDAILMASDMGDTARKLSKVRQDITAIRQSKDMDPDEKRRQIDDLSRQETVLARGANESFDAESGHLFQKLKIDYSILNDERKALEKAGQYAAAHKLKMDNDLYRKGNLVSMVERIKRQRKMVADSRLPEDEKQRRLSNFDQRIKEAMDRAVQAVGQ